MIVELEYSVEVRVYGQRGYGLVSVPVQVPW